MAVFGKPKDEQPPVITETSQQPPDSTEITVPDITSATATARDAEGTVTPLTSRDKFHRYLLDRAKIEGEVNADRLALQQLDDVFAAKTPDQLWAAMELTGLIALKDIDAGTHLTINGYTISPGDPQYKTPAYAIVDAYYTATGSEVQIDTGVERVLGFLRAVESGQAGLNFPVNVKVDKKNTSNGTAVTFVRP